VDAVVAALQADMDTSAQPAALSLLGALAAKLADGTANIANGAGDANANGGDTSMSGSNDALPARLLEAIYGEIYGCK
jgi:hypothetical protein